MLSNKIIDVKTNEDEEKLFDDQIWDAFEKKREAVYEKLRNGGDSSRELDEYLESIYDCLKFKLLDYVDLSGKGSFLHFLCKLNQVFSGHDKQFESLYSAYANNTSAEKIKEHLEKKDGMMPFDYLSAETKQTLNVVLAKIQSKAQLAPPVLVIPERPRDEDNQFAEDTMTKFEAELVDYMRDRTKLLFLERIKDHPLPQSEKFDENAFFDSIRKDVIEERYLLRDENLNFSRKSKSSAVKVDSKNHYQHREAIEKYHIQRYENILRDEIKKLVHEHQVSTTKLSSVSTAAPIKRQTPSEKKPARFASVGTGQKPFFQSNASSASTSSRLFKNGPVHSEERYYELQTDIINEFKPLQPQEQASKKRKVDALEKSVEQVLLNRLTLGWSSKDETVTMNSKTIPQWQCSAKFLTTLCKQLLPEIKVDIRQQPKGICKHHSVIIKISSSDKDKLIPVLQQKVKEQEENSREQAKEHVKSLGIA